MLPRDANASPCRRRRVCTGNNEEKWERSGGDLFRHHLFRMPRLRRAKTTSFSLSASKRAAAAQAAVFFLNMPRRKVPSHFCFAPRSLGPPTRKRHTQARHATHQSALSAASVCRFSLTSTSVGAVSAPRLASRHDGRRKEVLYLY